MWELHSGPENQAQTARSDEYLGHATCQYDVVTGKLIYERREYYRELPPDVYYDELGRVTCMIQNSELVRVEEFGRRPESDHDAADAA